MSERDRHTAYEEGRRNGHLDLIIGRKLEVSYMSNTFHDSEYARAYAAGYRAGWEGY